MTDAIDLLVEAPQQARIGDPVILRLTVESKLGTTAELRGANPAQRYFFTIVDSGEQEVWRSRFGEPILRIEDMWTVAPAQKVVYEETWNTKGNDGRPVPPGVYSVRGFVGLTGGPATSDPVEITIRPSQ